MTVGQIIFFSLLAVWAGYAVHSVLAAMLARKMLRRVRQPYAYERVEPFKHVTVPEPSRAVVMVPFKGSEPGLADHVTKLCTQDHPDYRLIFLVQDEDDPALPVLRGVMAANPDRSIELLITGESDGTVGQKVHNQLAALGPLVAAEQQSASGAVWVFADSDAAPGRDWLRKLIRPLDEPGVLVSSGYRWLVPAQDEENSSELAGVFASVMNGTVASFLARPQFAEAWGGSMAIAAATAADASNGGSILEHLHGSITDDYPLAQLARDKGGRVHFHPRCLVASPAAFTWGGLGNFAFRQYLITRTYRKRLYLAALGLVWASVLGACTVWLGALWYLVVQPNTYAWLPAVGVGLTAWVMDGQKVRWRRQMLREQFDAPTANACAAALWWDRWWPNAVHVVHGLLIARAGVGRVIRWRGISYRVRSPHKLERL